MTAIRSAALLLALPLLMSGCGWLAIGGGAVAVAASGGGGGGGGGGASSTAPQVQVNAATVDDRAMGDVPLTYALIDPEEDLADVTVEFQVAGGAFQACTPAASSPSTMGKVTAGGQGVSHMFVWDAATDLSPADEVVGVQLRVTAQQVGAAGLVGEDTSAAFRVGNVGPQVMNITVDAPGGTVTGATVVRFMVLDSLNDPTRIASYEYSRDAGVSWTAMSAAALVGGFTPGVTVATSGTTAVDFTWDTRREPGLASEVFNRQILIRLTPADTFTPSPMTGTAAVSGQAVSVDNNALPRSVNLFDASNDTSSPLGVPFVLSDADGDDVDVIIQWKSAGQSDFPDLNGALNPFVDLVNGLTMDDASVRAQVLANMQVRRDLQIISEVQSLDVPSFVAAGSDATALILPDLLGRVSPEELQGAVVDLGAETAMISSFVGATALLASPLSQAPPAGVTAVVKVPKTLLGKALDVTPSGKDYLALWDARSDFVGPVRAQVRVTPFDRRGGITSSSLRNDLLVEGVLQVNRPNLQIPPDPEGVTAADLDGDGDPDLIVSSADSGMVTLLFNRGGRFRPSPPFAVGAGATDAVTGDFDGDGLLDIAIISRDEGPNGERITLLLRDPNAPPSLNGNVAFALAAMQPPVFDFADGNSLTRGPEAVTAGDFDGDGRMDIAVALPTRDLVSVLLQDSATTQGAPVFVQGPLFTGNGTLSYPQAVAAGDFNNDQLTDLAISWGLDANSTNGVIEVYTQLGSTTGPTQPVIPGNGSVSVAPLTGPNSLSLAATINIDANSAGLFAPELNGGLVADDLNGDGLTDLVAVGFDASRLFIFRQTPGLGLFPLQLADLGDGPTRVAIGDIDNDGDKDILVTNELSEDVTLLIQDGLGFFQEPVGSPLEVGFEPRGITVASFFGDRPSAVVTSSFDDALIFVDSPTTTLLEVAQNVLPVPPLPNGIVARDLNGDGITDLAFTSLLGSNSSAGGNNGNLQVFRQNNLAQFQPLAGTPAPAGMRPGALAAGDFNADGRVDLAALGDKDVVRIFRQTAVATAPISSFTEISLVPNAKPVAIRSGDFNNDQLTDLVVLNELSQSIALLLQSQEGTLELLTLPFQLAGIPIAFATGDLNRDGLMDIAVASSGSDIGVPGAVQVFLQQAVFSDPSMLFVPGGQIFLDGGQTQADVQPSGLAIADVNNDGRSDLVVAVNVSIFGEVSDVFGALNFYLQDDQGFLDPNPFTRFFDDAGTLGELVAGDFDGDGKADLAVLDFDPTATFVRPLFQVPQAPGDEGELDLQRVFQERQGLFSVDFGANRLISADLNRDGLLDLLAFSPDDASVTVIFQQ